MRANHWNVMRTTITTSIAASFLAATFVLAGPAAGSPFSGGGAHLRFDHSTESEYQARVDRDRASDDLDTLVVTADLTDVARQHAAEMADELRTFPDRDLGDQIAGWDELGALVGRGTSVEAVHADWMSSPVHRSEILHGTYQHVGTGVAWGQDGRMYVAQVFRVPQPGFVPPAESRTDAEIAEARATGKPGASFGRVGAVDPATGPGGWAEVAGTVQTRSGDAARAAIADTVAAASSLGSDAAAAGSSTDLDGEAADGAGTAELVAAPVTDDSSGFAGLLALVAGISLLASSTLLVRVTVGARAARR